MAGEGQNRGRYRYRPALRLKRVLSQTVDDCLDDLQIFDIHGVRRLWRERAVFATAVMVRLRASGSFGIGHLEPPYKIGYSVPQG
jgi:hypothetical protein